ncbi:MAG: hypothetical protein RLY93_09890 [Sumerlaeia bacterium]
MQKTAAFARAFPTLLQLPLALAQTVRTNPLIERLAPWRRRSIFLRALFVTQVCLAGFLIVVIPLRAAALLVDFNDSEDGFVRTALMLTYLGNFLWGSIALPLNFCFFRFPYESPEQLRELRLTAVTERELRQALTFWGRAMGSLIPAISLILHLPLVFFYFIGLFFSSSGDVEDLFSLLGLVALNLTILLSSNWTMNFLWFRSSEIGRVAWIVFFLPFLILILIAAGVLSGLLLTFIGLVNPPFFVMQTSGIVVACLIMFFICKVWFHHSQNASTTYLRKRAWEE